MGVGGGEGDRDGGGVPLFLSGSVAAAAIGTIAAAAVLIIYGYVPMAVAQTLR